MNRLQSVRAATSRDPKPRTYAVRKESSRDFDKDILVRHLKAHGIEVTEVTDDYVGMRALRDQYANAMATYGFAYDAEMKLREAND